MKKGPNQGSDFDLTKAELIEVGFQWINIEMGRKVGGSLVMRLES